MKFFENITKKMAASGCEEEIRSYLKECLPGFDIFTDAHGSLIAHKSGKGEAKMLVTSLDLPTLFTTHIEKNGFVRFCSNGIDKEVLRGAKVRFCDGAKGVVYSEKDAAVTQMYIDTGNKKDVLPAEPVMIDSNLERIGNMLTGFCSGNYACIRSVTDVANMVEDINLYVVFLAKTINKIPSFGFMKDIEKISEIYVIDKSCANDTPDQDTKIIKMGGGAVIRIMDKSMVSSKRLVDKAVAVSRDIKVQREVSEKRTTLSAIHTAYTGTESIYFGVPVRYEGEMCESVSLTDIGELTKLIILNLEV